MCLCVLQRMTINYGSRDLGCDREKEYAGMCIQLTAMNAIPCPYKYTHSRTYYHQNGFESRNVRIVHN